MLIDDLRAGKRAHEVPRHGTLSRVRQQLPDTRAGVAPPDRNVEPVWLARNNEAPGGRIVSERSERTVGTARYSARSADRSLRASRRVRQ